MYTQKELMKHILLMVSTHFILNSDYLVSLDTSYLSLNVFVLNVHSNYFLPSIYWGKNKEYKKKNPFIYHTQSIESLNTNNVIG